METNCSYFRIPRGKWFLLMVLAVQYIYPQSWLQKADMPFKRNMAVAFTANNKQYVAGGIGPSGNSYVDLWEYDKTLDAWSQKADLPGSDKGCRNGIAFSYNGKAYVGLGLGASGAYKSELWEYDPAGDAWTQKASLPAQGREGSACFVINNKAYIIGGAAVSRFAEVWEYDITGDAWTLKGNYPVGPIISPVAFSINNKGYVTCGYPANNVTTLTYEYDPPANQWTLKTPFIGAARQELIAFVLNNIAYCGLGRGYTFSNFYNDMYSYDPVTDSWIQEANFPGAARPSAIAVADGARAYVGSGSSGGDCYGDFYEYTPANITSIKTKAQHPAYACYPVPSSGDIYLENLEMQKPVYYKMHDLRGNLVAGGKLPENRTIQTGVLPGGNYILSVIVGDEVIRRNIILQK